MGAMGTSTSAVAAGGRISNPSDTAASETWDGTSWTEGNDLNSERYAIANRGAGTQTAGLCAGGRNKGPGAYDALTEEYNGTSWTEVNDLPSGVESGSGLGTQTAAGLWGGYTGSYRASGFLYDGTNWTATTDFPFPSGSASESGTTTAGLLFGIFSNNTPGYVANTVSWDGTAFTEENDLATARGGGGGGKAGLNTNQNAIMVGGFESGGTYYANVEDWNFPPVTQDKLKEGMIFLSGGTTLKGFGKAAGIPAATWASGGTANTAGQESPGTGTQTAAIIAGRYGGDSPPLGALGVTELYNGSSWTEVNDMNTARYAGGFSGIQTSAIFGGGYTTTNTTNAETWDGTNWTEVGELNTARRALSHTAGESSSSALIAGGFSPGSGTAANAESWDGSSWTEVNDLNTGRRILITTGTATAALSFGGNTPDRANTEIWDGTSWTELNDLNTARHGLGGNGITTAALAYGGNTGRQATESWNGTSWTEVNDLSTGRQEGGSAGTAGVSALFGLGYTTARVATSEEFTADNALADVTVS